MRPPTNRPPTSDPDAKPEVDSSSATPPASSVGAAAADERPSSVACAARRPPRAGRTGGRLDDGRRRGRRARRGWVGAHRAPQQRVLVRLGGGLVGWSRERIGLGVRAGRIGGACRDGQRRGQQGQDRSKQRLVSWRSSYNWTVRPRKRPRSSNKLIRAARIDAGGAPEYLVSATRCAPSWSTSRRSCCSSRRWRSRWARSCVTSSAAGATRPSRGARRRSTA